MRIPLRRAVGAGSPAVGDGGGLHERVDPARQAEDHPDRPPAVRRTPARAPARPSPRRPPPPRATAARGDGGAGGEAGVGEPARDLADPAEAERQGGGVAAQSLLHEHRHQVDHHREDRQRRQRVGERRAARTARSGPWSATAGGAGRGVGAGRARSAVRHGWSSPHQCSGTVTTTRPASRTR